MRSFLCIAICALVPISTLAFAGDDLTGQAGIVDGDTLEIHGTRIRLWEMDAPETRLISAVAWEDEMSRSESM